MIYEKITAIPEQDLIRIEFKYEYVVVATVPESTWHDEDYVRLTTRAAQKVVARQGIKELEQYL